MVNEHISKLLDILALSYPDAKIALKYSNNWELLVAVILSAQCTDIMVNKVTSKLFLKYKKISEYTKVNISEFEQDIKSTGFFRNKAKNIVSTAKIIIEKFNGTVPNTMQDILTLPGVARKTANVVLGNAYKVFDGIAVDTHVFRISQRLRLVDTEVLKGKNYIEFKSNNHSVLDYKKDADPNKIEQELMNTIPKDHWFKLTYEIIDHGRKICKAQSPFCTLCPLTKYCPVSRV
jgi:endonuclease III